MIEDLTTIQLALCRHALGASSERPGFRNHFCATPGNPDDVEWQVMMNLGVAKLHGGPRPGLPYNMYFVNEPLATQIIAAKKEKEK